MTPFQSSLLNWYSAHQRSLPWRGENDPYKILLSEVLLQQTRVDQAIPYYHRFLKAFPTLSALGQADLEAVLKAWEGCGYYARARNLLKLAQQVKELPRSYKELLELPGIGSYTAAAVASIAFGEPVAAVDGNVRRVIARLEALENPTVKEIQAKADALLAHNQPSHWNQAMMELGATICSPKSPKCTQCPLSAHCMGKFSPEQFPMPKQRKQKAVAMVALILQGANGVHLEPRQGRILGGLWGVPMDEGQGALQRLESRFAVHGEWIGTVAHEFTHRKLTVQVYKATWEGRVEPLERPLSRLDQKILALVN